MRFSVWARALLPRLLAPLIHITSRRMSRVVGDAGNHEEPFQSADSASAESWRQWENFARAQELGQIGWWRLDTTRNVLTWSAENYRIFGQPIGTPQSYESFLQVVHPDDRAYVDEKWRAALRGEPYDLEHRVLVDGQEKWVREKACLEFDAAGALLGGFGVTQDITDRKHAEIALQWGVRRNELLTRIAARLLQSSDVQGAVEELCADVMQFLDCQAFFNYLVDDESGRLHLNACAGIPEDRAREIEWLDYGVAICGAVARDRERIVAENVCASADPRTALIASCGIKAYCCHPLMAQGRLMGTLSFGAKTRSAFGDDEIEVMQAVSQLVSMAMARLRVEQALLEADRRKDEFLATLAHELRNPLAPIRTGLLVLKRTGAQGPNAVRVQEMMERQVDHIVRLVDDLLEVSRIRSGKIELKRERLDLRDLMDQAIEASQQFLDANGVSLTVVRPDAPLMIDGDPVRLVQVIANLLSNAAKYTPSGGHAEIAARRVGSQAELTVADNGVGIPTDMLPHVFDLFAQVDRTLGRAQGGLGIGLALVRKLLRLHGGQVEARSDGPGKGSVFLVRLPLASAFAQGGPQREGGRSSRRVLVIEDDDDVVHGLSMLLRAQGANVRTAFDGKRGVEAVQSFHPQVVFIDLGLEGMDGYEAARRIRALPEGRDAIIIALTRWGGETAREHVKKAGFDLHIAKPVSMGDIERVLDFRR